MKKIMAGLLILGALTLSLQAYDQAERIQDMQTMEISMAEIQRGILYNNKKMVLKGVESLKKTSRKVEVSKKDEMDYSAAFAKKQTATEKLEASIEANQKHAATTNYTKVLNQCVSCHNKIRKWNP